MLAADTSPSALLPAGFPAALEQFIPEELRALGDVQTAIPRIARDERQMRLIETAVRKIPSRHRVVQGDSRRLDALPEDTVHLVVTSPPYWTLKASTKSHPAPYPVELAERLIRMFSFVGDTVLDLFMGTATTNVVAAKWGRNSVGVEVDPHYFKLACVRLTSETADLFGRLNIEKTLLESINYQFDKSL
jgi:DNA modification methylase